MQIRPKHKRRIQEENIIKMTSISAPESHRQDESFLRLQSHVPASIGSTSSDIEELELTVMRESLPPEIGNLTILKTLRIVESPIVLRSQELSKLKCKDIESLEIRCLFEESKLVSLPIQIWDFHCLQSLTINSPHGSMQCLPMEIERLTNLEELDVCNHELRLVPVSLSKLTKLRSLRLSATRLQQLPAEIGKLSNLEVLDLDMCSQLSVVDFLATATGLENSLKVIRVTHNVQLRSSSTQPFQQTARLAQLCQFVKKCKGIEVIDLKGNEIGNLEGFQSLLSSELQSTSRLRLISLKENPIIYHSLEEEDQARLAQLLRVHRSLGSFGGGQTIEGDRTIVDKVVDAIVLRSWACPETNHWIELNRTGRCLVMNQGQPTIALSVWPVVLARANHVFSKYRAKKRSANAIYFLLRNNPELLGSLG
ncbi:unnamed protein product [Cylindrotheca closterium]|uniref:Uncharacterized protein n=1 Tax=Cylindrotheca closterium TaxID=2856 RepID=A0AAD2JHX4_9STRA|nr:unnamed protein product [Cylindrotheca closterium]